MNTKFVYEYWSKYDLVQEALKLGYVSENDLLFMLPNNVKKRHHISMTRVLQKRKSVYKNIQKSSFRFNSRLAPILDYTISSVLPDLNSQFFGEFVELSNRAKN